MTEERGEYLRSLLPTVLLTASIFILIFVTGCINQPENESINITNISPEQAIKNVIEEPKNISNRSVNKTKHVKIIGNVSLTTDKKVYVAGSDIFITIQNNLNIPINISNIKNHENLPAVQYYYQGKWHELNITHNADDYSFMDGSPERIQTINPGENITLGYKGNKFMSEMRFVYYIHNQTFYSNEIRFTVAG